MYLDTMFWYSGLVLTAIWGAAIGTSEDICERMQIMIGLTSEGEGIIVHFPAANVGQTSESLEKCEKTGLPLAKVKCIKLRNWVVYDTFNLTTKPCNGSVIKKPNGSTTTAPAPAPEVTMQEVKPTSGTASSNETQKLVEGLLKEMMNIKQNQSMISPIEFHDVTAKADNLMTSLSATSNSGVRQASEQFLSAIVDTIDVLVDKVQLPASGSLNVTTSNFVVEVHDVKMNENGPLLNQSLSFVDKESSLSFDIPISSIQGVTSKHNRSHARVGFVLHKTSFLFRSSTFRTDQVISASISGLKEHTKLAEPISFKMNKSDIQFDNATEHLTCGFWDFSSSDWSEQGCKLQQDGEDTFVCRCSHLTNFAILVDLHRQEAGNKANEFKESDTMQFFHKNLIGIVSDVGCLLSILGLFLTIVIHMSFNNLRQRKPQKVLINLSLSLLFAYSIFLMGVRATEHFLICAFAAAFLHYFWLCAWCWMAVEGYTMYGLLVKVMDSRTVNNYTKKASLFAYGAPALIVLISAGLSLFYLDIDLSRNFARNGSLYFFSHKSNERTLWHLNVTVQAVNNHSTHYDIDWQSTYVGSDACWPWGNAFYYGFLLPVGLIFVFNCLSFCFVLFAITKGRSKIQSTARKQSAKRQLNNAVTMTALLGISWTFGFLAMISTDPVFLTVMQGLHAIFNSTQGFSIFVIFCVRHRTVRTTWMNALRRRLRCCRTKNTSSSISRMTPGAKDKRMKHVNGSKLRPTSSGTTKESDLSSSRSGLSVKRAPSVFK
ncbi:adhesion G-protein coupled receptor G6-like isoform X2 [Clavelina lepadiformis]|uniref:adhesion G-protein coupled receptor G6-like isoform X2 n=1 Tax=Clavelina lepadiformis TaxID=159417 RepID=UPI004041D65B